MRAENWWGKEQYIVTWTEGGQRNEHIFGEGEWIKAKALYKGKRSTDTGARVIGPYEHFTSEL